MARDRVQRTHHDAFREFMKQSKLQWNRRYPDFRKHYDGDKVAAYKLVKDHVKVPHIYHHLKSVHDLTAKMLERLPVDQFVIKAVLGSQGHRVICVHRKHGSYRDILRTTRFGRSKLSSMTVDDLLSYVKRVMRHKARSKGTELIIEQFLGDPYRGLPTDYKVYVVNGVAKMISIFVRRGKREYSNTFDREWNMIPLDRMFRDPSELEYIESAIDFEPLPSRAVRDRLLQTAEALARAHRTAFCRYDFYCIGDDIYFGEITPVCGDLNNYDILETPLNVLYPIRTDQ